MSDQQNEPGVPRLAARNDVAVLNFGGLAIVVTCVTLDPLALRPRLSPGLPLSVRLVSCTDGSADAVPHPVPSILFSGT